MLADDVARLRQQLSEVEEALGVGPAEVVGALQRMVNSGQEVLRRVVADVDAAGEWAAEGYRSVGSWVAVHATLTPKAGKRLAHEARGAAKLPATSALALDGRLNVDQVRQIVRCASAAPDKFDAECDEAFSALAASGGHGEFSQAVRGWMAAVDAERGPEGEPAEAKARFSMSETFEGWWHGEFHLTPEDGALVHQAIERRVGRYLRARRDGDPSIEPLPMSAVRAQEFVDRRHRATPRRHQAFGTGPLQHRGHVPSER